MKNGVGKIIERARKTIQLIKVECNRKAREKRLEYYGSDCFACGMSFSEQDSELATGYIQVHHLNPISGMYVEHTVDPIKDLRPICSNCDAVVHLQTRPMSLLKLKQMLS